MRLYLVQHGEARSKDEDPERHLSDEGRDSATKIAGMLRRCRPRVRALWHSGKTRAAETAEILAGAFEADEGVVQRDGLAPKDPVGPAAEAVAEAGDDVVIVGHQPFMGRLASLLVAGDAEADAVAVTYAAVLCLETAEEGGWRVAWYLVPDLVA